MLDKDGYPTEETLDKIREWDYKEGYHALMEFVKAIWRYADSGYWWQEENEYTISTGGWSGNEDIIGSLMDNTMFWIMCWYSSKRGGHYVFEVREVDRHIT